MIPVPGGVRVWLATGVADMRRGMNTLALQVQEDLGRDPHAGDLYLDDPLSAQRTVRRLGYAYSKTYVGLVVIVDSVQDSTQIQLP